MKPDLLAIAHSQIIDAKLKLLADVFTSVKNEANEQTAKMLNQLIVDKDGRCVKCKENRLLITKALSVERKLLRDKMSQVKSVYGDGIMQIEVLATDYITWLRNGKESQ
jgi:hypothetical protein